MRSQKSLTGMGKAFMMTIVLLFSASKASCLSVDEITRQLACDCGCNMVISQCVSAMECSMSDRITDEAQGLLNEGVPKDKAMEYFVMIYGEKILAVPTKKGFNLAAWVFPFFALALGGLGVYFFLKRTVISQEETGEGEEPHGEKKEAKTRYVDQVEKELKDFHV